jgi:hypothetical protein
MRRRDFIRGIAGSAAGWPLAARAQQSAMPVVGFISGSTAGERLVLLTAFRQGLGEIGYAEGKNVTIEYRYAEGQYDRIPTLLADLIQRRVAVIFAVMLLRRWQLGQQRRRFQSFSTVASMRSRLASSQASVGQPRSLQASI